MQEALASVAVVLLAGFFREGAQVRFPDGGELVFVGVFRTEQHLATRVGVQRHSGFELLVQVSQKSGVFFIMGKVFHGVSLSRSLKPDNISAVQFMYVWFIIPQEGELNEGDYTRSALSKSSPRDRRLYTVCKFC